MASGSITTLMGHGVRKARWKMVKKYCETLAEINKTIEILKFDLIRFTKILHDKNCRFGDFKFSRDFMKDRVKFTSIHLLVYRIRKVKALKNGIVKGYPSRLLIEQLEERYRG